MFLLFYTWFSKTRSEILTELRCTYKGLNVKSIPSHMCAQRKDQNQPAHPISLTSLRCPHKETLHPCYTKCARWWVWSDCANAQADLNLRWAHSKTCVRQPPSRLTLNSDWGGKSCLSFKGTCHVILLAKLHDMYHYKTTTILHQPLKSISKVAVLHRFYCIRQNHNSHVNQGPLFWPGLLNHHVHISLYSPPLS